MQAMLLAAGLGTRLHPLTTDRAKPAVPFLGKPLIHGLAEHLAKAGFTRAVVNTHHLPGSIHEALEGAPLAVSYSHEDEILGTAGALALARQRGLLANDEPVLIINAKLYTDLDLRAAIDAHARAGAAVTMVLRPNPSKEAFREVLLDGDRVRGFGKGRKPEGEAPLLFTGLHIVSPEVLASIPVKMCDTVADIYPPLIDARRVLAHVDPRGRWWELSTLERYLELHVRAHAEGIGPALSLSKGARIEPGAVVERSVLWEDARVEAGAVVRDSILGRGVVIPEGATVERAAIAGGHHVPITGTLDYLARS